MAGSDYNESKIALGETTEKKRGVSPWLKYGVPVLVLVIIGAVVGGVVGSRKSSNTNVSSNSGGANRHTTHTSTAESGPPTFGSGGNAVLAWPTETFKPSNPRPTSVRPDRPRLVAPAYKWAVLPDLIQAEPYLKQWNDTIFNNAATYYNQPVKKYYIDGGSGVLDIAREVKQRIKAFAYVYRMTNDTKWVDRTWQELQNAAGNGTQPFGTTGDNWYTKHFLDVAEFTAAFAIGYDWMYDAWTPTQRQQIMWSIITLGLEWGVKSYNDPDSQKSFGWWQNNINGNWNCVCNGGLTLGALAILKDDPTGVAETILGLTIPNAVDNCARGPSSDGTWSETPHYWYFGTTAHSEMSSSLITATGSDYNLVPQTYNLTGLFHMHVTGMTSLFSYGDHGPNKFSTTANSMMFYGSYFDSPTYTLFQRERDDAAEPWSMFWYDPAVGGAFWDGMPLDHYFDNDSNQWAAMRSSWTDNNGLYVGIKSGNPTHHQSHNDLDAGTFVIDAMGQRWAGELGSGDYLSKGYFQDERWLYYRTRTEGQNVLLVNNENQNLAAQPTVQYRSTGEKQGSSTVMEVDSSSTAYFTTDLTTTYSGQSIKRGIRLINGRKQVLLQDDLNSVSQPVEWRMHTNATVTIDGTKTTATLSLGGQTMDVRILNPASGVGFSTKDAVRAQSDPALPSGQSDQANPGVTVLCISLAQGGSQSLQVLFNPHWSGMSASDFKTPASVAIDKWTLTSHN